MTTLRDRFVREHQSTIVGLAAMGFSVRSGRLGEPAVGDHTIYAVSKAPNLLGELFDWLAARPEEFLAAIKEREELHRLVTSTKESARLRDEYCAKLKAAKTESEVKQIGEDLQRVRDGMAGGDVDQVRRVFAEELSRAKARDAIKPKELVRV